MTQKHKPRPRPVKPKTVKGRQTVVEMDQDEEVDAWVEPATDAQPGSQPLFKPKWERFAQLVCGGMGHEQAHKAAGFKPDTANAARLAKKEPVRTRIDWLKHQGAQLAFSGIQVAIDASGLNLDWIVQRLMQTAERCLTAVPVVVGGVPTGEYRFDSAGANRALELLGRIIGTENALAGRLPGNMDGEHVAKDLEDPRIVESLANIKRVRGMIVVDGDKKAKG